APEKSIPPEENQPVTAAPAKSEIQLPTATPDATPSPSATPKPSTKASPKPSATSEKKKPKTQARPAKEKERTKNLAAKKGDVKKSEREERAKSEGATAGGTQATTGSASSNAGWYGDMLHDRFYREWAQP